MASSLPSLIEDLEEVVQGESMGQLILQE